MRPAGLLWIEEEEKKRQLDENENLCSRLCNRQTRRDILWYRLKIYKSFRGEQIESDSLTTLTRVGISGRVDYV